MRPRSGSRLAVFGLLILGPLVAWLGVPLLSEGQAAKSASLQRKIDRKQSQIDAKRRTEGVLTGDISKVSQRISALQSDIDRLQSRQDTIQGDLDRKRAALLRLQDELRQERKRLAKLRARLNISRVVLGRRLAELYKADKPDLMTVVLNSKGFVDLLEQSEFLRRINNQDTRIITVVRDAKVESKIATDRLAVLEGRQQKLTEQVQARRDEIASVKSRIMNRRHGFDGVRAQKAGLLTQTKHQRQKLQEDVASLQKEQARIEGTLNSSSGAPIRKGSGRLIWPVNGPITSPFCERRAWEACHPGIDIGVGTGTPIHAADSGTVRIASSYGGYGNYTCIQHTAELTTCYAHQSQFMVSVGQNVSQGQVIGLVGCTGLCFGAHLHFEVRINGSVVNPLNYL
jgi:murein DD-endopeptidase MepM/ murein hydrolase activator NlpD